MLLEESSQHSVSVEGYDNVVGKLLHMCLYYCRENAAALLLTDDIAAVK